MLKFLTNQKIEVEVGEKEKMAANLSEAQTNIENEEIEKDTGKLTWLLMIVCDGKYVLYFNNAWRVCCIIWRKLLEELLGCFYAELQMYLLQMKAWINVADFSDQTFAFDMPQEYMIYILHLY